MPPPDMALVGSYDYRLVALSIFIAILASYAALDLSGRVTSAQGRMRFLWLCGGAMAMGIGIGQCTTLVYRHTICQFQYNMTGRLYCNRSWLLYVRPPRLCLS